MGLVAVKPLAGTYATLAAWLSEVHDTINAMLDPHCWRLSLSATSVASGSDVKLAYTNHAIAPVGVTVNAGKDRVTFNKAGRYQMRASTRWPTGGTAGTETQTAIRRYNSANVLQEVIPQGSPGAPVATNNASGSMAVAAGDYCEVWVFQSSTVAKVPDNGPSVPLGWTMFEGRWVGTS
jgi:hypothetical protein